MTTPKVGDYLVLWKYANGDSLAYIKSPFYPTKLRFEILNISGHSNYDVATVLLSGTVCENASYAVTQNDGQKVFQVSINSMAQFESVVTYCKYCYEK